MKTPEDILKDALGEIRYKLNGTVTNAQLKWALEEYAKLYHESKVEKISFNLPVISSVCVVCKRNAELVGEEMCRDCWSDIHGM